MTLGWVSSPPSPWACARSSQATCGATSAVTWCTRQERADDQPAALSHAWNGAWTCGDCRARDDRHARGGRLSAAEFAGEPTVREATTQRYRAVPGHRPRPGTSGPVSLRREYPLLNFFTACIRRGPELPGAATGWHVLLQPAQLQPVEWDDFLSIVAGPLRCVH